MSECQTAPCRSVTFRGLEVTLLLVAPHMHAHTHALSARGVHFALATGRRRRPGRTEPGQGAASQTRLLLQFRFPSRGPTVGSTAVRAGRSQGPPPGRHDPVFPGAGSPTPHSVGRGPRGPRGACPLHTAGLAVSGEHRRVARPVRRRRRWTRGPTSPRPRRPRSGSRFSAGGVPHAASPGGRLHISYGVIFRFSDGYVAIESFFYPLLLQHSMQSSLAH